MDSISLKDSTFGDKNKPEEKDKLSSNPRNVPTENQPTLAEMNEKLDKILKYQKRVSKVAVMRGIISFIFFLVFIVLPIVGGYYLVRYVRGSEAYQRAVEQYQEFYEMAGDLKGTKDQVEDLKGAIDLDEVKNLINGDEKAAPKLPTE